MDPLLQPLAVGPWHSSELIQVQRGALSCVSSQQKANIRFWRGDLPFIYKSWATNFLLFFCYGKESVLSLQLAGNINSCFLGYLSWRGCALSRKKSSFLHKRRVSLTILIENGRSISTSVEGGTCGWGRWWCSCLRIAQGAGCVNSCWHIQPGYPAEIKLVAHVMDSCDCSQAFGFWLDSTLCYSMNLSNNIRTNKNNHGSFIDVDIVTWK